MTLLKCLLYDRALTPPEIAQVERYLSLKYNIGVPANTAPQSVVVDNFTVSNTQLNGWSVLDIVGGVPTRDRYTLQWVTDGGQPALKIGTTGIIGVNGLPQGRVNLPGNLPDTLGGGTRCDSQILQIIADRHNAHQFEPCERCYTSSQKQTQKIRIDSNATSHQRSASF
jgi:hypothetical protein